MSRWIQRILFIGAFSLLAYSGYVWMDTWFFQKQDQLAVEISRVPGSLGGRRALRAADSPHPVAIAGLVGRIEIPRIGVSAIILEGTSNKTLRRAVGHISGTALPGQRGNIGLSGHRDTFFRPLRNIRRDDIITLTTMLEQHHYRVLSTQIGSPNNVAVLYSGEAEILTLVTCYPFYFIGSAPERFIVKAERVISKRSTRKEYPLAGSL